MTDIQSSAEARSDMRVAEDVAMPIGKIFEEDLMALLWLDKEVLDYVRPLIDQLNNPPVKELLQNRSRVAESDIKALHEVWSVLGQEPTGKATVGLGALMVDYKGRIQKEQSVTTRDFHVVAMSTATAAVIAAKATLLSALAFQLGLDGAGQLLQSIADDNNSQLSVREIVNATLNPG